MPSRRGVGSVQVMIDLAQEHGLSIAQCLQQTGISPAQLADPTTQVEASQELQVIDNLVRALPDVKGLGLQAGMRYQLSTLGIWGFAIISSATVRAAIEVALRFADLSLVLAKYSLHEDDDSAEFHIDIAHIPAHLRQFVLERQFLITLLLIRSMMSEQIIRPRDIYLTVDTLPFTQMPAIIQESRLHLGASANRLVFDRAVLDRATPQANAATAQFCVRQCEELLDQRKQQSGFAGQVRALLLAHIGQMPSLQAAAQHFNMSPRTFRRRLDDEQASFRALLEETRAGVAMELLATAQLSVESVAERMGYAETASFIHAFKRWTGSTPGKYRAAQASSALHTKCILRDTLRR